MKVLAKQIVFFCFAASVQAFAQDVAVLLIPRGIGDLSDDGLHVRVGWVIAEVKTHRIKTVSEVAQMSE